MQPFLFHTQVVSYGIRSAAREDLRDVVEIDRACQRFAWTRQRFDRLARQRGSMFLVAEADRHPIGYMLCGISKYTLRILRMAVAPAFRRLGIGSDLLRFRALEEHRQVFVDVREDNLGAQLFLRASGFRAINTFVGIDAVERVTWYRFVRDGRLHHRGGGQISTRGVTQPARQNSANFRDIRGGEGSTERTAGS